MKTTEKTIKELRAKIDELEASLKVDTSAGFDYPICKKEKNSGVIVLFDGLKSGKVLFDDCKVWSHNDYSDIWEEHTNTKVWEDYPYDKERNLYHKQMVYCWPDENTHEVMIRFYDAINKCAFTYDGEADGLYFENYSATMPDFMLEAHKTLKD